MTWATFWPHCLFTCGHREQGLGFSTSDSSPGTMEITGIFPSYLTVVRSSWASVCEAPGPLSAELKWRSYRCTNTRHHPGTRARWPPRVPSPQGPSHTLPQLHTPSPQPWGTKSCCLASTPDAGFLKITPQHNSKYTHNCRLNCIICDR